MGKIAISAILAVSAAFPQAEQIKVGSIDFFGHKGLDTKSIRAALPVRVGEALTASKDAIRQSIHPVIGREPTDVQVICCDAELNRMVYIGLPGESSKQIGYNAAPQGNSRLPPDFVTLHEEISAALEDAVAKGRAGEDMSRGYSLPEDPVTRARTLELRDHALRQEETLFRVLESSSDPWHRAIATEALGYVRPSGQQVEALVKASLDPDNDVRNAAVRALGVRAMSDPDFARSIPAGQFIDLLASGIWTDRNKAASLVWSLTSSRDADLLSELRSKALDPLLEMARWRNPGHALPARMILGRIAGIDDIRLVELVNTGQVEQIVNSLQPVE